MSYREFSPPVALAHIIECVWTVVPASCENALIVPPAPVAAHTILPDGAMDIITTFCDDGAIDETFVVGAMTSPQLATVGNQSVVGVRFLPGAGGSAIGVNASTLTDNQADVRDVVKTAATLRDGFRALRLDASNAHALHLFANSLAIGSRNVPAIVRESAKLLADTTHPTRVEDVAKQLRISRQHLRRVFTQHSGLSPKLFAQICRVRALLAAVTRRSGSGVLEPRIVPSDSWSMLAAEFGYADQSHLIAEVKTVIGKTPAEWARSGSNIPILPVPVSAL